MGQQERELGQRLRILLDRAGVSGTRWHRLLRYPRYRGGAITLLRDLLPVDPGGWDVEDGCSMGHELVCKGSALLWVAWRLEVTCKGVRLQQAHIAQIARDGRVLSQLTRVLGYGWCRTADPVYLSSVLEGMLERPMQWDIVE